MSRLRGTAPRTLGARRALVAQTLAALALSRCGPPSFRPNGAQRPPPCAAQTHAGLDTGAAAWTGNGFIALVADGRAVVARRLDVRLEPMGEAAVVFDDAPGAVTSIARSPRGNATLGAAVSRGVLHVAWIDAAGRAREPTHADLPGAAQVRALVRGVSDVDGAVVYSASGMTRLAPVSPEGALGEPRECPVGLEPRTVVRLDDGGLAGLAFDTDEATGETTAARLVMMDEQCHTRSARAIATATTFNGTRQSLLSAGGALYAAFGDREQRVWLAAFDANGAPSQPARVIARDATAPTLLARRDGVGVLLVRDDGAAQQLELLDFDPALVQRTMHRVSSAGLLRVRFVAADPWGGALAGWEQTLPGVVPGARASALQFFARVCP